MSQLVIAPIIIICGTDALKKKKAIEEYKNLVDIDYKDFDLVSLAFTKELTPTELLDQCKTVPFASEYKVVTIDFGKEIPKSYQNEFKNYLSGTNSGCILVACCENLDNRSMFVKQLKKLHPKAVLVCDTERNKDFKLRVQSLCDELGIKIENPAIDELICRIGEDSMGVQTQLKSLKELTECKTITKAVIQEHVAWVSDIKPWFVADAFGKKDIESLISYLHRYKESEYLGFLLHITKRVRELLIVKSCEQTGGNVASELGSIMMSYSNTGRKVSYQNWQIVPLKQMSRNFSKQELIQKLLLCLTCEENLKGGMSDKQSAMVDFVIQLCS